MGGSMTCYKKKPTLIERVHPKPELLIEPNQTPSSNNQSILGAPLTGVPRSTEINLPQSNKPERINSFSSHTTIGEFKAPNIPPAIEQVVEPPLQQINEEQPMSNSSLMSQNVSNTLLASASPQLGQISESQEKQEQIAHDDSSDSDSEYDEEEEEDDYEIDYVQGDLIQEGGRVHSALNVLNGQLLAVKIYELEEEDVDLAFSILDQLLEIDHEKIHQIITYDTTKGPSTFTVVMPFESGGSINWLLQKFNKFSPHLAAIFMKQILEGLAYLHSQGLTHQNLKTSNVLVDENANAKLSDINILNRYELSIYSAPECFEGREYSPYADVWSAGCIFIEMLTQNNPWQSQYGETVSLDEIRNHLQNGRLFSLQNIVLPDILQVLKIIFKKNPEERLTAAQLLELQFFKQKIFETNEYKQSLFQAGQSQKLWSSPQTTSQMQGGSHVSRGKAHSKGNKTPAFPLIRTSSIMSKEEVRQSQGLSKNSNSNSQKSISSQSKGSLKKQQLPHQTKTIGNLKRQSSLLKKMMHRMHTVEVDIQSSIVMEDHGHTLSSQELRMLLNMKNIAFKDIIEEEENMADERAAASPQPKHNPLINMGLIRNIAQSDDMGNAFGKQLQSLGSEDSNELKLHTQKHTKHAKNFQFSANTKSVHSSHSSSGSQNLSHSKGNQKGSLKHTRAISRDEHTQARGLITPQLVLNQSDAQQREQEVSKKQIQIAKQLIGDTSPKQPKNTNAKDIELIKKLTTSDQEDQAKELEQFMANQFYSVQQTPEKENLQKSDDRNKLEELMNQQFYASETPSPEKLTDAQLLEKLMGQQYYSSEYSPEKNVQNTEADPLFRIEQVIMDQYNASQEEASGPNQLEELEKLMARQFFDLASSPQQADKPEKKGGDVALNELEELEKQMARQFFAMNDEEPKVPEKKAVEINQLEELEKLMAKQFFDFRDNCDQSKESREDQNMISPVKPICENSGQPNTDRNDRDEFIDYSFGGSLAAKNGFRELNHKMSEESIRSPLKLMELMNQVVPEEDEIPNTSNVSNLSNLSNLQSSQVKQMKKSSQKGKQLETQDSTEILKKKKKNQLQKKATVIIKKRTSKTSNNSHNNTQVEGLQPIQSSKMLQYENSSSKTLEGEGCLSLQFKDVIQFQSGMYEQAHPTPSSELTQLKLNTENSERHVTQTEQSEGKMNIWNPRDYDFEVKGDVSNFEAKQPILEQGFFFLQKKLVFVNLDHLEQEWNNGAEVDEDEFLKECLDFRFE